MKRSLVVPALLLALGIGGCGASSGHGAVAGVSTSTTTPTVVAGQDIAADRAAGEAANLKLSDMPAGWTSKPASKDDSSKLDADIANCLGVPVADYSARTPASVDSPDFSSDGNNLGISSTVAYEPTLEVARHRLQIITNPKLPACVAPAMASYVKDLVTHPKGGNALPSGTSVGNPTVSPMSFPPMGDGSIAFRATVPMTYRSLDVNVRIDLIAVLKGRVGVTMGFTSFELPTSPDDEQRYTQLVLDRITRP